MPMYIVVQFVYIARIVKKHQKKKKKKKSHVLPPGDFLWD